MTTNVAGVGSTLWRAEQRIRVPYARRLKFEPLYT